MAGSKLKTSFLFYMVTLYICMSLGRRSCCRRHCSVVVMPAVEACWEAAWRTFSLTLAFMRHA